MTLSKTIEEVGDQGVQCHLDAISKFTHLINIIEKLLQAYYKPDVLDIRDSSEQRNKNSCYHIAHVLVMGRQILNTSK